MKLIYIAGPYRSDTEWGVLTNIRNAEKEALFVWQNGGAALCPHKNTAFFGGAAPDKVWLDGDIEMLKRCDAIYLTGEYNKSRGTMSEFIVAVENDIPVLLTRSEVTAFIKMSDTKSFKMTKKQINTMMNEIKKAQMETSV